MQYHAADQLHVEVPHVKHAAPSLAHHREGFHQDSVQDFLKSVVLLFFEALLTVDIRFVL